MFVEIENEYVSGVSPDDEFTIRKKDNKYNFVRKGKLLVPWSKAFDSVKRFCCGYAEVYVEKNGEGFKGYVSKHGEIFFNPEDVIEIEYIVKESICRKMTIELIKKAKTKEEVDLAENEYYYKRNKLKIEKNAKLNQLENKKESVEKKANYLSAYKQIRCQKIVKGYWEDVTNNN